MKEINKIYLANFLMGVAYSIAVIETLYRLSSGLNQTQIALLSSLFFISYSVECAVYIFFANIRIMLPIMLPIKTIVSLCGIAYFIVLFHHG